MKYTIILILICLGCAGEDGKSIPFSEYEGLLSGKWYWLSETYTDIQGSKKEFSPETVGYSKSLTFEQNIYMYQKNDSLICKDKYVLIEERKAIDGEYRPHIRLEKWIQLGNTIGFDHDLEIKFETHTKLILTHRVYDNTSVYMYQKTD